MDGAIHYMNDLRLHSITVDGMSFPNPQEYLRSHFMYPEVLLATMADTGSLLSGSRALNYFKPGSCNFDSDWDFYIPGCENSVSKMMSALELCGVEFNVIWRDIERLINAPVGHTLKTTIRDLRNARSLYGSVVTWEQQPMFSLLDRRMSRNCMRIITALYNATADMLRRAAGETTSCCHANVTVKKKSRTNRELCLSVDLSDIALNDGATQSSSVYYDSGKNMCVISGKLLMDRRSVPVQMIIARPQSLEGMVSLPTAMGLITKFYGSHVQCFISGWFAGQMFPKYTDKMESIDWNTGQGPPSERAKTKYKGRGFSFVPPSTCPTLNVEYSSDMRVVSFRDIYGLTLSNDTQSRIGDYIDLLERWMQRVSWSSDEEGRLHMNVDDELKRARLNVHGDITSFTQAIYGSLPKDMLPASMPVSSKTSDGLKLVGDLQRSGLVPTLLETSHMCCCL